MTAYAQVKYGSYTHDAGNVKLSISRKSAREDWIIEGKLTGTESELTTKINALIAAYSTNGSTLKLVSSSGSDSAHVLVGATIETIEWPDSTSPEYATCRTYRITAWGPINGGENTLSPGEVTFQETLSIEGGGARFVMVATFDGPRKQEIDGVAPYRAVQSGFSKSQTGYPTPPSPLFASDEHVDQRRIEKKGPPRQVAGSTTVYEVSWTYVFESATALSGSPNV